MEFKLNDTLYKETIFDGYFITNDGEVAKMQFEDGKLKKYLRMKNEITKTGHMRVEINHKHYLVHRLVYQTWSGDTLDNELVIDHIDANPQNNHIDNLRQVTQQENVHNAICHGNFGHNGNTKIKVYDDITKTETIYPSIKSFLIAIKAPDYIVRHNSLNGLKKRTEYKRYRVVKIDEH